MNECYDCSGLNENHSQSGYSSPKEKGKCFSCEYDFKLMEIDKYTHIENLPDENCLKMHENLCIEPAIGKYINEYKSLTCPNIYTVCKYDEKNETNTEPYECTFGNTLFKENNKLSCDETEYTCLIHDLGKLGNRFCKECIDGYFIDNGHCKSCDPNCIQCSGLGKCFKCAQNYILINGRCQSKEAMRCSKVDNRTICYECESSYNFDNGGDCVLNSDVC